MGVTETNQRLGALNDYGVKYQSNIVMQGDTINNMPSETQIMTPAVQVQNAFKAYGKGPPILDNFKMTVQRGTIYGLLGASGCGKTTMLSCIVGLRKLDKGEINVFGARPGTKESGIPGKTIGYMPQEIALYELFSIKEILQYFGRIYGMSQTEILARMEFLAKFLDLPDCTQMISSLSGGQQRRTSLAVAMMHEPELLILDEPTVGVDPLIRENIWEYLCEMVQRRKTTVIITTHYIEEARQSNMVGLMRNGRLLVEKPPPTLLKEYNTHLLEDIVLKLCKKDNMLPLDKSLSNEITDAISETSFYSRKYRNPRTDTFEKQGSVVGLKYRSRSPDYDTLFSPRQNYESPQRKKSFVQQVNSNMSDHVNIVLSLVIRNFIMIIRNPVFFIILLTIPTLQISLVSFILGGSSTNIKMGLIDNEMTTGALSSCSGKGEGCFNGSLTCSFINESSKDFEWKEFLSETDALKDVQMGKSWGYVSIPANFTQHMKDRSLYRNFVTNNTLDGITISAHLDMSASVQRSIMMELMFDHYLSFLKTTISECGGDPRAVEIPLKVDAVYGSLDGGFLEFMQPSTILLIIYVLPMANAINYVLDKKAGTLDRTLVAGVEFFHILLALIISEATFLITQLALGFGAATLFFGFVIKGSWILIFLLSVFTGITGLTIGFFLGTICTHELEVMILILGTYMPILLLSGGTWPLEGTHHLLRIFCEMLPVTFPIESFRSISSRGWGFTHPKVWPGFATVAIWIILMCMLNVTLHRLRK